MFFKMKKSIIFLFVFIFSLVSNKVVSQSNTANAIATVRVVDPLTITKKLDLNFGTVSSSAADGMIVLSPDGTTTVNGGVTIIDQSLLTAASFEVTGPADTSFVITIPNGWIGLTNENSQVVDLYAMTSNPSGNGILDSAGKATVLVGASITVHASQGPGLYQGNFAVTVNLN